MSRIIELDKCGLTSWGKQGESEAIILTAPAHDFLALSEGEPVAVFKRWKKSPYVHACALSGDEVQMALTAKDTKYAGKCQVTFYWKKAGSTLCAKSSTYYGYITPDLSAGSASIDEIQNLIDQAAELVELITSADKVVFCDELPEVGDPNRLYVLPGENGTYTWENDAWVVKEANDSDTHYWKNI